MANEKPKERALVLRADFADVYISSYGGELMKPVKASFKLSEKKGHYYKIQKKYIISSTGYIQLNKAASVNIVTPKSVIVDGKMENNPYVERHPLTRAIDSVAVRKIGIGFSPIGNITVIDKTLFYNVYTYLIQSIQAKMKAKEWDNKTNRLTDKPKHPGCGVVGTRDDKPEKGKWIFYLTADPLGIWVNYEHQAILDCLEEHTQRQRFGDRIAQKICERNILRDHPAIGVDTVFPEEDGTARVNVYSWRHELNPQNLDDILQQAERGSKEIEIKAEVVEPDAEEEKTEREQETKTEEEVKPKISESEPPPEYWEKQARQAEAEKEAAGKDEAEKKIADKNLFEGQNQKNGAKPKTKPSSK
jgi:hypothetical protein